MRLRGYSRIAFLLLCAFLLIAMNACFRSRNRNLFLAASSGDLQRLESLVSAGQDLNITDPEGETPLMYAAENGQTAAVSWLLTNGANLNAVSKNDETALDRAIVAGQASVVKVLVNGGADIRRDSPVIEALLHKNSDIAELLLDLGADPNAEDVYGDTALIYAARNNLPLKFVKALIAAGGNVSHRNKQGKTARDVASAYGHNQLAESLSRPNDRR